MFLVFMLYLQSESSLDQDPMTDPYIQHVFQQEASGFRVDQRKIRPILKPFLRQHGAKFRPNYLTLSGLMIWFVMTWWLLLRSFRWKWIDEPVSLLKTGLMIPWLVLVPVIMWALMYKIHLPFNLAIILLLVFSHLIYTFSAACFLKTSIENSALVMFLFVLSQVFLITGARTFVVNSSWF